MTTAAPRAIGRYTAEQIARLAGVSARKIGRWAQAGIIPTSGPRPHEYTYAAAGEAVLAHYLVKQKVPVTTVREIVEALRTTYGDWPLSHAPLDHDGALVVVRDTDGLRFTAVGAQGVIAGTLLDLRKLSDALRHGGWVSIEKERPYIAVDPNRHSGAPTLSGKRLSTAMVAEIASEEGGLDALRRDYGLSQYEIDAAVDYERDVEEALAAA